MSRPKNPPKIIYSTWSEEKRRFIYFDKQAADFLTQLGKKPIVYELQTPQPDGPSPQRWPYSPLGQDKPPEGQPVASLPATKPVKQWFCDCGAEFDEPYYDDGAPYCPQCKNATITKRLMPEPSKKRHRRTNKAEIGLATGQTQPKDKWKCTRCDWTGDNPPKRLAGINKGQFCCPECGAEVVKNE